MFDGLRGLSLRGLFRRFSNRLYVDVGDSNATIFIAGMGRSGTTWVEAVVNHDFGHRVMFEPFLAHDVPAAAAFPHNPYVRPSDRDPDRLRAAETILSGRTPRGTVDRHHRGWIFRRRIIKDVRCNLMLGYLKAIRPAMPLVFVVRNPWSIAASWIRLGWGNVPYEETLELDAILEQQELLADFPVIQRAMVGLDRSDAFERIIFQWCLLHLVPLRQLGDGDAHMLRYEDLVREPLQTADRMAAYLQLRLEGPGLARALARSTTTDFLRRGPRMDRSALLSDWKAVLSPGQIDRGREILASFGLDRLYDENGLPLPELALAGGQPPGATGSSS